MRLIAFALASVLCAATAWGQPPGLTPVSSVIAGATAYVYSETGFDELRLYVFDAPEVSSSGKPAIVLFFGGLWAESRVDQFVAQARYFRGRGMVAVVAEYRVRNHGATPFEAIADAKAAIRWVRTHASALNVDPSRIAAGGADAGAHAALSAAMFDWGDEPPDAPGIDARPDALLLYGPIVDTTHVEVFGTRREEASPMHHLVRRLPPTIIFQGRQDATVDVQQVEQFCASASALGGRCDLLLYEGAGRGFFERSVQGGRWYLTTLLDADRFLTSLGYLAAPVSTTPPE